MEERHLISSNMKWKEVLEIKSGKNQKDVADINGSYPIYGSGGIIGYSKEYLCPAGTTIIGRKGTINSPLYVNEPFWNVDTAFGLIPSQQLVSKYLYYFCCYFNFKALDKSTTIPSLAKRDLENVEMPVPPLDEQSRIVAHIEELFSELDKAVDTLKTTKEQLEVYRQAVLKDAFSCLPETVEMDKIADMIDPQPSHRTPPEYKNGIPYIGIGDIDYQNKKINFEDARKVSPEVLDEHLRRYTIHKGDFVMGKIGTIGKPYKIPDEQNYALSANVILIQPNKEKIDPEFLFWQFSSSLVTKQLTLGAKATSQPAFGIKKARLLSIKICELEKQFKIIKRLEAEMSCCDNIEKTVDTALAQADAMRQSILKQAFEGKI